MKKYDLILENGEKIHFSNFCLKNEADQVSLRADFSKLYQQISKMALPGAGRSFNLKSHQRRTHYLHPIQNGSQSPEHGAIVAPPPDLDRVNAQLSSSRQYSSSSFQEHFSFFLALKPQGEKLWTNFSLVIFQRSYLKFSIIATQN